MAASGSTAVETAEEDFRPGERLFGFWEPDGAWYPCVLLKLRRTDRRPKVQWEDGTFSLLDLKEVTRKRKRKEAPGPPAVLELAPRHALPPHRYVLAPMVGGSELPFRMMARRYGAQLCYTPMMYSGPFASDASYREDPELGLHTCREDRPLVAHFCGNDPDVLLKAAKHVVGKVDAVDLNLGCPQRVAHSEHFGAYLLDEADRELVCRIVKRLSDSLPVPVFCKIRLLDEMDDTVRLVKQLEASGASLIAVHARYRGTPTHRRDGPAHLDQLPALKKVLRIPLLANGNVRAWGDVVANLESTGADGVMSAEGLLDDPCLFWRAKESEPQSAPELRRVEKRLRKAEALCERQRAGEELAERELEEATQRGALRKERRRLLGAAAEGAAPPSDGLGKVRCYLELCRKYQVPPLRTVLFHCRRMAKEELSRFQLLDELLAASSLEAAEAVLARAEAYRDRPDSFVFDKDKVLKEQEQAKQKSYELACRKKFEQRMARKAKREGETFSALLRATSVPGGMLSFGAEPSWLLEKDDNDTGEAQPSEKRSRWDRWQRRW